MSAPRRFLAAGAAATSRIRLDAAESHHLLRVLRLAPGTAVEVFDGAGRTFAARFLHPDDEGLCLLRRERPLSSREPTTRLAVGLAIPKGDGFAAATRQLAELGVASVTPVLTEHSEGAAAPSRLPRWRAAALSGTRQCGRAVVPPVRAPVRFAEWIRSALPEDRWIASPRHGKEDRCALPRPPDSDSDSCDRALVIGPEGGFSPEELQDAYRHGFRRLDLGERVLRTGTACLVAAAALLSSRG